MKLYARLKSATNITDFIMKNSAKSITDVRFHLDEKTMISAFRSLSSRSYPTEQAADWQRREIILSSVRSPSAAARHFVGQGLIINSNLGVRAICDSAPLSTGSLKDATPCFLLTWHIRESAPAL